MMLTNYRYLPNVSLDVSLDGESLVAVLTLELVRVGLVRLNNVGAHLFLSNLLGKITHD